MRSKRKWRTLFYHLFSKHSLGCVNHTRFKNWSYRVHARCLIVTSAWWVINNGYSHSPQLLSQRRTRCFGFNQHHIRLPIIVLTHCYFFKFWKVPPSLLTVQKNNTIGRIVRWTKHSPRRYGWIVSRFFFRKRGIVRLHDVVNWGQRVFVPALPPISFYNRTFFCCRILHPLSVPFHTRQRRLYFKQFVLRPELRPEWFFSFWKYSRKLYYFPLIG